MNKNDIAIALITNGTIIIVAALQAWHHKGHEKIAKETRDEVKKHNLECPGHGNGRNHEQHEVE